MDETANQQGDEADQPATDDDAGARPSPLVLIAVILVALAIAYIALAQLAGNSSPVAPVVGATAGVGGAAIR